MVTEISYSVIRTDRKTTAIQIMDDGAVLVRCPKTLSDRRIRELVQSKARWILKKQAAVPPATEKLTQTQLKTLQQQAKAVFAARVAHFAPRVGVSPGHVTVRAQKTRWGSCSAKGNLNFNCLLLLAPQAVLDYVVVHELCHLKEMNHSTRFWALVAQHIPDATQRKKWLKANGPALIAKLP